MTIDEVNAMSRVQFAERFGFLFEHSPWVVANAATRRPFSDAGDMYRALIGAMRGADPTAQLALLRAHPELAGKAAVAKELTDASSAEQASAGLDRLTPHEFAEFHRLNDAYQSRFGFPFIICVRRTDKAGILAAMQRRQVNSREDEFETALAQVAEIVELRLQDTLA